MASAENYQSYVQPMARILPVEESKRARKRLLGTIEEEETRLKSMQQFVTDNDVLSGTVRELPNRVSHQVMVPFGRAAFFPGKLVHTNEMMVFLGEGYYAQRSAQQTSELLARRAEFLHTRVTALEAQIADLRTELQFAEDSMADAEAGMVEIREPYAEADDSSSRATPPAPVRKDVHQERLRQAWPDDAEDRRIAERLKELELAEAAAEALGEGGEEGDDSQDADHDEEEEDSQDDDRDEEEEQGVDQGAGWERGESREGWGDGQGKNAVEFVVDSGMVQEGRVCDKVAEAHFDSSSPQEEVVKEPLVVTDLPTAKSEQEKGAKARGDTPAGFGSGFTRGFLQKEAKGRKAKHVTFKDEPPAPAKPVMPEQKAVQVSVVERTMESSAAPLESASPPQAEAAQRPLSRFKQRRMEQ